MPQIKTYSISTPANSASIRSCVGWIDVSKLGLRQLLLILPSNHHALTVEGSLSALSKAYISF